VAHLLPNAGTERAFTGKTVNGYPHDNKQEGTYVAACEFWCPQLCDQRRWQLVLPFPHAWPKSCGAAVARLTRTHCCSHGTYLEKSALLLLRFTHIAVGGLPLFTKDGKYESGEWAFAKGCAGGADAAKLLTAQGLYCHFQKQGTLMLTMVRQDA